MKIASNKTDFAALGKRVKNRRAILNMTQEELAEKSELSVHQIGNIERATSKCSIEAMVSLCFALDVTPDYLILGTYKQLDLRQSDLFKDLLLRADEETRQEIIDYAVWKTERIKKK